MHLEHGIVLLTTSASAIATMGQKSSGNSAFNSRAAAALGFIGKTGSGKSTRDRSDHRPVWSPRAAGSKSTACPLTSANRRAWQARIAHVPQSIYLADSSQFEENIAFGLDARDIDLQRVREAARTAQLAEFIETLPRTVPNRSGRARLISSRAVSASASVWPAPYTNRRTSFVE